MTTRDTTCSIISSVLPSQILRQRKSLVRCGCLPQTCKGLRFLESHSRTPQSRKRYLECQASVTIRQQPHPSIFSVDMNSTLSYISFMSKFSTCLNKLHDEVGLCILEIYNLDPKQQKIFREDTDLAIVAFVQVVQGLCSRGHDSNRGGVGNECHEIKEMAALLNQSAARVLVKSVPVVHLHKEGEPVLPNGHHPHTPKCIVLLHLLQ